MNVQCDLCGKLDYRSPSQRKGPRFRCHPCRRLEPKPAKARPVRECDGCGVAFEIPWRHRAKRFCTVECWRAVTFTAPAQDPYYYRARRVPGLKAHRRAALLRQWRKQGRGCFYCNGDCETVDHVVALKRGGTNHEGNLVPCCRQCNATKGARLIVEWRLGRSVGSTTTIRPWMSDDWVDTARRQPVKPPPELSLVLDAACAVCAQVFTPRSAKNATCSHACSVEWAARMARNAYRRKVGKPEDWTTPTKKRGGRDATSDGHQVRQVRRQPDRAA